MCSGCGSLLSEARQEVTVVTNSWKGFFPSPSASQGLSIGSGPAPSTTQVSINETRLRHQTPLHALTCPLIRHPGEQLSLQPPSPACYLLKWKSRLQNLFLKLKKNTFYVKHPTSISLELLDKSAICMLILTLCKPLLPYFYSSFTHWEDLKPPKCNYNWKTFP